jgi:hypothetical protein
VDPAVQAILAMPTVSQTAHSARLATEAFAQKLVQDGAIMTLPGQPGRHALIGDLRWSNGSICWFTAFGDAASDAHRIDFTEAQTVQRHGIHFVNEDMAAGYLSSIDAADVEDPDDYRVAWQLWQQIAPLRTKLIEDSYAQLQTGNGRVSFAG